MHRYSKSITIPRPPPDINERCQSTNLLLKTLNLVIIREFCFGIKSTEIILELLNVFAELLSFVLLVSLNSVQFLPNTMQTLFKATNLQNSSFTGAHILRRPQFLNGGTGRSKRRLQFLIAEAVMGMVVGMGMGMVMVMGW